jgi:predicted DsbA family dithiol-disulfide isomerase
VRVEVWSDVVCPWCYLGKRRLESALGRFAHGDEVEVAWRSFELDPAAPPRRAVSAAEHLASKYGLSMEQVEASWARLTALGDAEGIEFRLEQARGGSSFDAHRLTHLGARHGVRDAVTERLFRAYFAEAAAIGDRETLARLGVEVGLPADEVEDALATDHFAAEVRDEERRARELGITAVPFFVIDGRYGIVGAQSADILREALEAVWGERAAAMS